MERKKEGCFLKSPVDGVEEFEILETHHWVTFFSRQNLLYLYTSYSSSSSPSNKNMAHILNLATTKNI